MSKPSDTGLIFVAIAILWAAYVMADTYKEVNGWIKIENKGFPTQWVKGDAHHD